MLPENDLRPQLVLASSAITEASGKGSSLAFFLNIERATYSQLKQEIDPTVVKIFAAPLTTTPVRLANTTT